ncbi:MAG: dihydroxy-acid dehydratase [Lachnospiraceae bacterium]|nr:dihydroxy-acid dehydratase [Lachnospiraceae bacterium]
MNTRSQNILVGPEWANVRSLYKSGGYSDAELKKPMIGVVTAFSDICPGHTNLRQIMTRVKEGIYAAGGTPLEFGTVGACDGITMAHDGMKYVLPIRDMIANDVEAMVQAHQLDGIVLIGSCDKIVPGMLLASLRINVPAIFINGGPTLPGRMKEGNPYGGEYLDHSVIQQSEGALKAGKISEEEFTWIENNAVPTIGSCAMLGTANTMCCLAEAMGMALPGCAAIPAVYSRRQSIAFETGLAIMDLVRNDIRPRDVITKESLLNAIRVNSAIGGSTNAVLHILAIAYEAGVDLDIFEFGEVSMSIPHLVPMIPAGAYTLLDFYEAGGVQTIMKELGDSIYQDCMTCTCQTVAQNLVPVKNRNNDVIRSLDNPAHHCGGIAILKGNLAPEGAVTKPSAIPQEAHEFTGPAKIYEGEQDALRGIRGGEIKGGEVIVIRNEGPAGSPGMPEMYKAMKILVGMGLGGKCCLITDGRFSGSNNGCFVGHMCPEAFNDGPIAYLKDGDVIHVDVEKGIIEALDVDFEARRAEGPSFTFEPAKGCLYQYRKSAVSASKGAYIPTRD